MMLRHEATIPNNLGSINPNDYPFLKKVDPAYCAHMSKSAKPFEDIGERLYWHRSYEGLDQEQYASKAGFKASTYGNWETGYSRISLDGARALRATYGLTLDFIIEGIPDALPASLYKAWRDRPSTK